MPKKVKERLLKTIQNPEFYLLDLEKYGALRYFKFQIKNTPQNQYFPANADRKACSSQILRFSICQTQPK